MIDTPWYYKLIGVFSIIIAIILFLDIISDSNHSKEFDFSKENYDKIKIGMTKEDVFLILGTDATISESETPGLGRLEIYHYQKSLSTKAITVTFVNGTVYSKNWTDI